MTRAEILNRYPNASESFIRANCTTPVRSGNDRIKPRVPDSKQAERATALATKREGKTQSPGCPRVRFTLCRVRLLDVDAKFSSVKDTLDCLAVCGLIPGDREGEITLEVRQLKVSKYCEEKTLIQIVYGRLT